MLPARIEPEKGRQRTPASSDLVALRLTQNHLAHLRAVAEGVPVEESARRYLGVEHGAQVRLAHARVVELVAQISRRRLAGWPAVSAHVVPADQMAAPSIEEWAESEGLSDWSMTELHDLYREKFGGPSPRDRRRMRALERLRRQRLAALDQLAGLAIEAPNTADRVDGWLAAPLATALHTRGIYTLGELQALIARGGRWWAGLPAYGRIKAQRLAEHIALLVGPATKPVFNVVRSVNLSGRQGKNRAPQSVCRTDAQDDMEALAAWISSRSGSQATSRAYEREARRMLLWMHARGRAVSDAMAEDCRAYMDFLENIPDSWISRQRASPGRPGWAPFAGPLTVESQRYAVGILHSWFSWMVAAGYLVSNPWELVNRRIGDDRAAPPTGGGSRAFTPPSWEALMAVVHGEPHAAARARWQWMLAFSLCTGLRPAELVAVKRGDLFSEGGQWWVRVVGKGSRARNVVLPSAALDATRDYFAARGLDFATAPAGAPLLATLQNPMAAPTYTTIAQAFSRLVRRAGRESALSMSDRNSMHQASLHWLRHTHATRGVERGIPLDVMQANLGHASPNTTAGYYRAQEKRRARALEDAFGPST